MCAQETELCGFAMMKLLIARVKFSSVPRQHASSLQYTQNIEICLLLERSMRGTLNGYVFVHRS